MGASQNIVSRCGLSKAADKTNNFLEIIQGISPIHLWKWKLGIKTAAL